MRWFYCASTMEFFVSQFYAEDRTISVTGAEYLRVVSLAVAGYDWVITMPAEYRFYRSQSRMLRPSIACVLFVLIRYTSIFVLIAASVGYWGHFTSQACDRYYMLVPVIKTIQSVICQAILSIRTYALSKRSNRAGYFLIGMFVTFAIAEAFTNIYGRIPNNREGRCGSGNAPGKSVAWIFFVFAMIYDVVTLCMSAYYLLGRSPIEYFSFSRLARMILADGLGYFFILTAVNILNLVLFRQSTKEFQGAASPLAQVVTWIMSQRILIHLRDASDDTSRGRTPKDLPNFGVPDGGSSHEMGIRISIRREVENNVDEPDTRSSTKETLGSARKDREAFADV